MIAKVVRTQSAAQQNMEQTQNLHNGRTNNQRIINTPGNAINNRKSIKTVFLIGIRDKWQAKTLFLSILSTFLDSSGVFDCRLPGVTNNRTTAFERTAA